MPQKRPTATSDTSAPQFVVGLSVQAWGFDGQDITTRGHIEAGKAHISWSYRDHGRWCPTRSIAIPEAKNVWHVLRQLPGGAGRPYIVCPRAHDQLTLCGLWDEIDSGRLSIVKIKKSKSKSTKPQYHPLIMSKTCNVIGWNDGIRNYRAVSIDNLVKLGLSDICIALGWEHKIPASGITANALPLWEPQLVSEICLAWTQWQIDWWIKNQCGSWADSQGQAAMNTYRAKGIPSILKTHDLPATTELESAACYGGRVGVFFGGTVGTKAGWEQFAGSPKWMPDLPNINEPVTRYDVRSMYPTIMRDRTFPVKLLHKSNRVTINQLAATIKTQLVIAAVRIESKRGEVPCRSKKDVSYPVGLFDTTLATPDLQECLRHDEIKTVYCMAVYQPGRPFQKWADWMLKARSVQAGESNAAGQALVKSLSNAFSGKMGSRKQFWKVNQSVNAPGRWEEFYKYNADTGDKVKFRSRAGIVEEWIDSESRNGLLAACYAHITSYGRVHMALMRGLCGNQSVIWQDTDGIIVRESARVRMDLTGGLDSGAFGTFRTEQTYHNAHFWGAKAYWYDGDWIVSGIHNTWRIADENDVLEVQISNPANTTHKPSDGRLLIRIKHHDLNDLSKLNLYDANGWLINRVSRMMTSDIIDRDSCPQCLGFGGEQ